MDDVAGAVRAGEGTHVDGGAFCLEAGLEEGGGFGVDGVVLRGIAGGGLVFFAAEAEVPSVGFVGDDGVVSEGDDLVVFDYCGGGLEVSDEGAGGFLGENLLDGIFGKFREGARGVVVFSVANRLGFIGEGGFVFEFGGFGIDGGEFGAEMEGAMEGAVDDDGVSEVELFDNFDAVALGVFEEFEATGGLRCEAREKGGGEGFELGLVFEAGDVFFFSDAKGDFAAREVFFEELFDARVAHFARREDEVIIHICRRTFWRVF